MVKVQIDHPDGEDWFDLPAVPRVGDKLEFADERLLTVEQVVWTVWDDAGQHVIVIVR